MKKQTIFILTLTLVVIPGIVIWNYINKPVTKVDNVTAITIEADALVNAFVKDEMLANKTYLNQAIAVTGTISELSKNQDGKTVIILQTSDPLNGVQCTLRDSATLSIGNRVTIKGYCTGYTLVVILSDCIIQQ